MLPLLERRKNPLAGHVSVSSTGRLQYFLVEDIMYETSLVVNDSSKTCKAKVWYYTAKYYLYTTNRFSPEIIHT